MTRKNARLFELLVVGGGLWIASGCGSELAPQRPQQSSPTVRQPAPDGGVLDGGADGRDPNAGTGSGFW